jgi:hypothetical protein
MTNVYNNYRIVNILIVKFPMRMEKKKKKNQQHLLKYWEFSTTLLNQIWSRIFLKTRVHNTLVLLTLVYANEIWALRIKDKITDINREEIFQKNCRVQPI